MIRQRVREDEVAKLRGEMENKDTIIADLRLNARDEQFRPIQPGGSSFTVSPGNGTTGIYENYDVQHETQRGMMLEDDYGTWPGTSTYFNNIPCIPRANGPMQVPEPFKERFEQPNNGSTQSHSAAASQTTPNYQRFQGPGTSAAWPQTMQQAMQSTQSLLTSNANNDFGLNGGYDGGNYGLEYGWAGETELEIDMDVLQVLQDFN